MLQTDRPTVLVTGGASGMGAASAARFVQAGYAVLLTDIAETGSDVAKELNATGATAAFVPADVSQPTEVANVVEACLANFGRIDTLVNCAGIDGAGEHLLDFTEEDFDRVMDVNIKGTMFAMQYAAAAMKEAGTRGAIVNVASIAATIGVMGLSVYSASKGAVVSATRTAALELGKYGIRVNAVCPGIVRTGMMANSEVFSAETLNKTAGRSPVRRIGEANELAETIYFLGSPLSSFTTGSVVAVDGGLSAVLS
jgi:NAD(P)-dependent dehydrogenase (short-subunit alcohol dehydrogenase family)